MTIWRKIISACFALLLMSPIASGQLPASGRNIRIEVQMESAGSLHEGFYQADHQSKSTQLLIVADGLEGRLFIGEQVPYTVWYQTYLRNEGYLVSNIQFRNVGTGLIVTPRIMGDQIEVTLTPEISYDTRDGRGTIAVTKLSTTVRVMNGQSIDLGGGTQKTEFENTFYTRQTGQAVRVVLTPTVLES